MNKFQTIEKKVKELVYNLYHVKFENMQHILIQNAWFETKDGQESIGSEKAKEMIASNNLKVEGIKKELAFLKKHATRKV